MFAWAIIGASVPPTGAPAVKMDHLPLPSLQLYTVFSGLGLFYAVAYSLTASGGLFETLWNDVWCATAVVNFVCCLYFQLMTFLHSVVFGPIHNIEKRHMQDRFWNFVFYKFIFIFGVMNIQDVWEILLWCGWGSLVGCFLLTSQLCKDRFLYLSFSPTTPSSSHAKIILLLSCILASCAGLFMVCAIVGWQFGFNHFAFLFSEVYILFTFTLLTLIRYIIHLWDMHHEGLWENRNTYTYYAEFILEISSLCVQFLHHFHMLLWANMFLSVASLILLMKLRFLYQEIQRKMKRHHNYILVKNTLEKSFHLVKPDELSNDEVCAICWEKMNTARKLSCGHMFHFGCLRSWLEQDPVCPTCRMKLDPSLQEDSREQRNGTQQRRNRRNWLLYFNGASIASWLPTFSLEVHQPNNDDFLRGAHEVQSMFPDVPFNAITVDLANTRSVSQTVDNILSGSVPFQQSQETGTTTVQSLEKSDTQEEPAINGDSVSENMNNNLRQKSLEKSDTQEEPAINGDSVSENMNTNLRQRFPKSESSQSEQKMTVTTKKTDQIKSVLPIGERKQQLLEKAREKYLQKHPHLKKN